MVCTVGWPSHHNTTGGVKGLTKTDATNVGTEVRRQTEANNVHTH